MSNFKQAIKWVKEGKEIRRKSWEGKSTKGYKPYYSEWRYSIEEIEADDWEIYCQEHEWVSAMIWTGKDYCKYKCKNCGIKKPEEETKENQILKLIVSQNEALKHVSQQVLNLYIDSGRPFINLFGIDVYVTSEEIKGGILFKQSVHN